ncbi:MAG TPA: D-2-hydroxyacid dehydrogenase [Candidatus Eisenbacteria bacterium]
MKPLLVLEFVRHPDAVWNLPRHLVEDLRAGFPEVSFVSPADQDEADLRLPEADVVFGWAVKPENFARASKLRWIQVTAASVASLLFPELIESPVLVTNGRGLHAVSMAEHALGVLLGFARKLHLARDAQRGRRWAQERLWAEPPAFGQLAGTTLGLVGFGAVGRAIAARARPLGLEVIAVRRHPDPTPDPADAQWGVERLSELLVRSDWVVLAVPLTAETRGLIGAPELARMKPTAALVNLGRGALVDEVALVRALESGRIAGAALDVFDREPLPDASPLWSIPQVLLTPHVSGIGPRLWERATDLFRRNLEAFLTGRPLENLVDKRAGY